MSDNFCPILVLLYYTVPLISCTASSPCLVEVPDSCVSMIPGYHSIQTHISSNTVDKTANTLTLSVINGSAIFIILACRGTLKQRQQNRPFRQAYGELGELRSFLPGVPFVCMSATVTADTLLAVSTSLNLQSTLILTVDINKSNIR